MFIVKRDGRQEAVHFDKITSRINKLAWGLSPVVDPIIVSMKVIQGVYAGVHTSKLDELAAETAAHMVTVHPDYGLLAARIEVSNLHKNTKKQFHEVISDLYNYINPRTGERGPLISENVYKIVMKNAEYLNSKVVYDRDYSYDYFGIKTLMRSYLLRINGQIAERPQHMLLRVSLGIHQNSARMLEDAVETYDLMSQKWFTHATPTLFNSGTQRPQMSSCFLLSMKDDSIEGIYDTLKQCAQISKNAGGIGVAIHGIRAAGSYIRGTNGQSNGIIPMLRVFNNTARYVDQGGGKRKGSFAMYLEPWHADIMEFLDLRKNHGNEEERCRDLFFGIWMPDLFMKRVESDAMWSLMCPNECKRLHTTYGQEFEELYGQYERDGKFIKQIKARTLWSALLQSQIETGTPYMCYKDSCNHKSNQKNLGTIKSSNLCTEIMEYTSEDEVAVCNLASLALPKFVVQDKSTADAASSSASASGSSASNTNGINGGHGKQALGQRGKNGMRFDFKKLLEITKVVTRNLDRVIDENYYPVKEAENSNFRHRPIGIGVQGLADVFLLMRIPFDSPEAKALNAQIFECIYFAACTASMEMSKLAGPYSSFHGSPASKGLLQFDLWYHERQHTLSNMARKKRRPAKAQPIHEAEAEAAAAVAQKTGANDDGSVSNNTSDYANVESLPVNVVHFKNENSNRNSADAAEAAANDGSLSENINTLNVQPQSGSGASSSAASSSSVVADDQKTSSVSMSVSEEEPENSTDAKNTNASASGDFDVYEAHSSLSGLFDWVSLKKQIAKHGLRNSLLVAPMPTASTSQILGNNECFEPYTSNVYIRRTLAGEFVCINNHLLRDLIKLGIWSPLVKDKLIAANGSVQNLSEIPTEMKQLYKTVWELSQKRLIDMAADRGRFVDQSQSFNIHMMDVNYAKLTSMHFYGWKKRLKTGMYYLRTKAAADAIQFTVDKAAIEKDEKLMGTQRQTVISNLVEDDCLMCGS